MSTLAIALAGGVLLTLAVASYRHRALLHDSGRLAVRLVKHPDVPRPLRWLLVLACLPIPGPVDELAGGLAVLLLLRMRPGLVTGTWSEIRAARGTSAAPARHPAP